MKHRSLSALNLAAAAAADVSWSTLNGRSCPEVRSSRHPDYGDF